jgi:hypothetical protein
LKEPACASSFEIDEADDEAVIATITAPGTKARDERGALNVVAISRALNRRESPSGRLLL